LCQARRFFEVIAALLQKKEQSLTQKGTKIALLMQRKHGGVDAE
jgi:hypothetical protein